jgi:hypothetical protein
MRKLTLDLDTLCVESFAAAEDAQPLRGTVDAHSYVSKEYGPCSEPASDYCQPTDFHWNTCGVSCWYMCFPTGDNETCQDC